MPPFRARLVSSGEELLLGHLVDTNAAWLAGQVTSLGGSVEGVRTVGDRQADIEEAIRESARGADAVVMTGGLGPTEDDRARHALAAVLGTVLDEDAESWAAIQRRFAAMSRPCGDANRVQALVPRGARPLSNPRGTAPGLEARVGGCRVFALPGVPHEMRGMWADHVAPALAARGAAGSVLARRLRVYGLGESVVGERVRAWMRPGGAVQAGTTVADMMTTVRLVARADGAEAARRALDAAWAEVRALLEPHVVGEEDDTLADAAARLLAARGQTLAVAESCTGGLLADAFIQAPGASDWFLEGVVAYANAAKTSRLGVCPALLERHGAVSGEVARAMAAGCRAQSGADWALATTGVAGPGGGTVPKPVGLVWVALAGPAGVEAREHRFADDRGENRRRAVNAALDLLRQALLQ